MKKTYIQPAAAVSIIAATSMVCGSQSVRSDIGIDYGGEDEEGDKDPASRRRRTVWDDEEDLDEK